jgi:hypothetical protein
VLVNVGAGAPPAVVGPPAVNFVEPSRPTVLSMAGGCTPFE